MDEYNQTFSNTSFQEDSSAETYHQDNVREDNPFDRFMHNSNLDMLEAALPYMGTNMRKALALYIKSREMNHILHDLDREDVLTACGFERRPGGPEAMLQAMKMAAGKNSNPQLDQLLHMMNMMRTYQNFNEMMQRNPEMANFITTIMNQNQGTDLGAMAAQMMNQNGNSDMMSKLSQNINPDMLSKLGQNMNPDMLSKLGQNMNPDMLSKLSQNINPDMLSKLSQNMNPDMMSMLSQMMNNKDFSR